MLLFKNYSGLLFYIGIFIVCLLQVMWVCHAYQLTYYQLIVNAEEVFERAYQKEQTYRIPVVDIVNPGSVSIESCGPEEIIIVRKCPGPDTVVYNNISGHSIEDVINRIFFDLREHIVPMNINCLSDLFAGLLHDKGIPAYFIIERLDKKTNQIMDTSWLPDKKMLTVDEGTVIYIDISENETLRAIIEIRPYIVFGRMVHILILTCLLTLLTLYLWILSYRKTACKDIKFAESAAGEDIKTTGSAAEEDADGEIFNIGLYRFYPTKNVLQFSGMHHQLNKKENAILYALCTRQGNVVGREYLLEANWGCNGLIYSRSLDTYITTLRKYLRNDPSVQIVTVKGVGYKLIF